jgi:hypothetical protein
MNKPVSTLTLRPSPQPDFRSDLDLNHIAQGANERERILKFETNRHWRNARTLSSHNPTTYKARSTGQYEISGTPLPAKGCF